MYQLVSGNLRLRHLLVIVGLLYSELGFPADTISELGPWEWLLGSRDQLSRQISSLGHNLDEWLAGEGVGEQVNETYLSVRLNQVAGSFDGYNSKLKIGGRLDLPRVSDRWKLIFESDVEELNSLEENVLDDAQSSASIGGFRYQNVTDSGWEISHDFGLQARLPADPFYRMRLAYGADIGNLWSLAIRQKIWHYDSRGWGYDTEFSFIKELAADRIFSYTTEFNFEDADNITEFGQTLTLHQTLGAMETLSYELGFLGQNRPNLRVDDYYTRVLYRKAVFENWLIFEVAPQIIVSREENWRPQPRLMVNLEVLFFDF